MMRGLAAVIATAALLAAAPAAVAEEPGTVAGVFRLTLVGEIPENLSFYVEDDMGGGVICTTDAAMVEAGYEECAGGGAANELAFEAPANEAFSYRIIGSRGVGLSRFVVAEGSATAQDGLAVEASYAFPGAEPGDASPRDQAPEQTAAVPAADQYGYGTAGVGAADVASGGGAAPDARPGDPTGGSGLLPETGGPPAVLGGGPLVLAGGPISPVL